MRKWLKFVTLSLMLITAPALAEMVLIEDGEVMVALEEFQDALEQLSQTERGDVLHGPDTVRMFAERLLARKKMLREAEAQGLHQMLQVDEPPTRAQQRLLLETLAGNHIHRPIPPELDTLAEEFYLAHAAQFREPEQIRVAQIFLAVTNPDQREAVRAEAEDLHRRLQSGADFAELARAHSDGPNAPDGGTIPDWQVRGEREHPVLETAFALPEAGAISEVLEDEGGFRILKLLERRDSHLPPFEAVKDRIRPLLEQQYRQQLRDNYINSFAPSEAAVIREDLLRSLTR